MLPSVPLAPDDARRLAEGRGSGRLDDYRPWITRQEVPSLGLSSGEWSFRTSREYHFLSGLETRFFHVTEWSDRIVDVREQFPLLPVDATLAIAHGLDVRHPVAHGAKLPRVATTDFVLTVRTNRGLREEAVACKPAAALEDGRTLDKLEIERRYWAARGVPWRLVTERDVPDVLAANAKWARGRPDTDRLGIPPAYDVERLLDGLLEDLTTTPGAALSAACLAFDDRLGLRMGTSLSLARYALAVGRWRADPHTRWDPLRPLPALRGGRPAAPRAPASPTVTPAVSAGRTA